MTRSLVTEAGILIMTLDKEAQWCLACMAVSLVVMAGCAVHQTFFK